jgi:hypothetical protein
MLGNGIIGQHAEGTLETTTSVGDRATWDDVRTAQQQDKWNKMIFIVAFGTQRSGDKPGREQIPRSRATILAPARARTPPGRQAFAK